MITTPCVVGVQGHEPSRAIVIGQRRSSARKGGDLDDESEALLERSVVLVAWA
jgi:hypothetical protein